MWRMNVRGQYKEKVFMVGKFFVSNHNDFSTGDILLIQVIKSDEPGLLKRVKGFMMFQRYGEDTENDSFEIYRRRWRYVIIPSSVQKFSSEDKFNFSDLLGKQRAKMYDAQAEAIPLRSEDELLVRQRISNYLHSD